MSPARRLSLILLLALLASCARVVPEPRGPGLATSAVLLGVAAGPSITQVPLRPTDAANALDAFAASCRVATTREDVSGLTATSDWLAPCAEAAAWPRPQAAAFFARHFVPVRVGDGAAFATGYFEPEIRGSRTPRPGFDVPVYRVPPDLERCWRDDIPADQREGRAPLSRRLPSGECVAHYTRAEIEDGALAGQGLELAWAADPVELFFLQIQGSGRLLTPEGEVIRIGYANQNGHSYTGIGAVMRQRGLIGEGTPYATSMQGIMRYLREHPAEGRDIMRENESWIFFTELTGPDALIGPLGSIAVPVRGESSVAIDPNFVPYGAPVLLDLDRAEADGLWIAQDTGGAIRGANRFDTFWGAGERARDIAGGMSARGSALVLLPRSAAARLGL